MGKQRTMASWLSSGHVRKLGRGAAYQKWIHEDKMEAYINHELGGLLSSIVER